MKFHTVIAALALAFAPFGAAHAALVGSTVSADYFFPDEATPYPFGTATPSTFVIGAGTETTIDVEGVTDIVIDFDDDGLVVIFNTILSMPTWNVTDFNGVIFEGAALSSIVSVSVNAMTTFAGFDMSRVSVVGDRLLLDWNGLSYVDGTRLELDFTTSEIPLPFGWTLMMAGLAIGSGVRALRHKPDAALS